MPAPPVPAAEAMRLRARRKRLRRRILIGVWVAPLALLAGTLYFAFGPKPPPPPVPLPVSPQEAAVATQHVDSVRQALTQPARAPAPKAASKLHSPGDADGTPITLRVSQADLNTYISGNRRFRASLEAKGVHAATVALTPPDDLTIHAAATFQGISGNALVAATLTPALRLHITQARFGRFPPPVIRAAADLIIGRILGRARTTIPANVQSVRVVGTDLVITETRKAAPSPSH